MSAPDCVEPEVLIVTPYHREPRAVIERCIASVTAQTVPTAHLLVADGYPADWIGGFGVRHIALDRCYRNFGNTPRAIGLMAGVGEGYRAIGLLDADNWLDPDHVAACLACAGQFPLADYIVARRRFRRIDGSIMVMADEPIDQHVDTSCFFFLPGSFAALPLWGTIPSPLAPICDRVFYAAIRGRGMVGACTERVTVNYQVTVDLFYQRLGEPVPEGCKPGVDIAAIARWIDGLSPAERRLAERHAGVRLHSDGPPG